MAAGRLVPMNDMLMDAEKRGYAVGAFNVYDLAGVQAVAQAAEEERSPVIIQIYTSSGGPVEMRYMVAMAEVAAGSVGVPVALHLDHGRDLEEVKVCIEEGFSSIMVDASKLPLAENIEITRKAVEMAHAAGVSAEAELGKVGSGEQEISAENRKESLTDPEKARRFVQETGVDALAVAIGSAHGIYSFKPELDFDRLTEIRNAVDARLVLHGGSDLPEDQIRRAVKMGITKINVATDLAVAHSTALRELVANQDGIIWSGQALAAVQEAMKGLVGEKMRIFGSAGMAKPR